MRAPSLSFVLLVASACSYRPARFADRPPVTQVRDSAPIPVPEPTRLIEAVYLSDVYLRRPLVDALDAERFPRAGDVNAGDEVPRSSWWSPVPLDRSGFRRAYATDGPPQPPLKRVSDAELGDARGKRYRLVRDPDGYPGTRTAAAVIVSRLVRAIGYRTPEVWLVRLGRERVAAVRSPPEIDLGPTAMGGTRSDDANDRVPHRDRRTLRALGVLATWLAIPDLGPARVRDVYVGAPGRGHVRHRIVGLDEALGAAGIAPASARQTAVGVVRGNALTNLVTLGLLRPDPRSGPPARNLQALPITVGADDALQTPWEPVDRLLPEDGYWMAKRMAALPGALLADAVAFADLDPVTSAHVLGALEARRTALIATWLGRVTPLELVRLRGRRLVLSDVAITLGFADDAHTRYRIGWLDEQGRAVAPPFRARPDLGELDLALPSDPPPYLVARIVGERAAAALPRAFEAHIAMRGSAHVVGIRH